MADRLDVALPRHPLGGEVPVQRAHRLSPDAQVPAAKAQRRRARQDGARPGPFELASDERAHLQVLGVRRRVDDPDGPTVRQRAQPRDELLDDVRRVVPVREAGSAREAGQTERLVVTARAVGVDLARLPVPRRVEQKVDTHERRRVPGGVRRGREAQRVVLEAVTRALARIDVRPRRRPTDLAYDRLGSLHRSQVQVGRKEKRVNVHAPLSADERVPRAPRPGSRARDGSRSGSASEMGTTTGKWGICLASREG